MYCESIQKCLKNMVDWIDVWMWVPVFGWFLGHWFNLQRCEPKKCDWIVYAWLHHPSEPIPPVVVWKIRKISYTYEKEMIYSNSSSNFTKSPRRFVSYLSPDRFLMKFLQHKHTWFCSARSDSTNSISLAFHAFFICCMRCHDAMMPCLCAYLFLLLAVLLAAACLGLRWQPALWTGCC